MSKIQQGYLLPRIEQDENFRERFYSDEHSVEPDYLPSPSSITHTVLMINIQHNGENPMKHIYQFDCLQDNQPTHLSVDLDQAQPGQVVMNLHIEENMIQLQFDKEEFAELCDMRFRFIYPKEDDLTPTKLSLVA